jgi:hypothetical protein
LAEGEGHVTLNLELGTLEHILVTAVSLKGSLVPVPKLHCLLSRSGFYLTGAVPLGLSFLLASCYQGPIIIFLKLKE